MKWSARNRRCFIQGEGDCSAVVAARANQSKYEKGASTYKMSFAKFMRTKTKNKDLDLSREQKKLISVGKNYTPSLNI